MDGPFRDPEGTLSAVCEAEGSFVSSSGPFVLVNLGSPSDKNHEVCPKSPSATDTEDGGCSGHLYGGAFAHCRNARRWGTVFPGQLAHATQVNWRMLPRSPDDLAWFEKVKARVEKDEALQRYSVDSFIKTLKPENEEVAGRLFEILDVSKKGFVSRAEMGQCLRKLYTGCFCQKFRLLFDLYDTNGNGVIDEEEFGAVINSSIDKNSLVLSTDQVAYLSKNLFDAIDTDHNGVISFGELRDFFDRSPTLLHLFEVSFSRTLAPSQHSAPSSTTGRKCRQIRVPHFLSWTYAVHHPREAIWGWMFGSALVAAFFLGFALAYQSKKIEVGWPCGLFLACAKGFGKLLTWTSTWSLLLMLRESITCLRDTHFRHYVPFDSTAYAHKINAYVLIAATFGHLLMHFACYGCFELNGGSERTAEVAQNTTGGALATDGWRNPVAVVLSANVEMMSGWLAFLALLVILTGALPFVRRTGHFEIFFYSHLLGYTTYFVTLFVHARNSFFWVFASVPAALFLLEKAYNLWRVHLKKSCKVKVRKVVQWPSGVTQLTLQRPLNFRFSAGSYVFIKVPALTDFEWHPFTISSCPEDHDRLVLHIRSAGDWTRRLYDLFHQRITLSTSLSFSAKQSYKMSGKRAGVIDRRKKLSILSKKRPSMLPRVLRETDVTVCVRGPYGTPTGLVFECEHAVLICAGIGVTPFAAILQSIVARHQKIVETAVNSHEPIQLGKHVFLRKVDFIWVVRDQRNLEWFVELLQQLDAAQHGEERFHRFLELHIYVTSATNMSDLQSFALTSALETFYQRHQRDLITGIAARARHGRPNWQTVFETIKEQRRGKVSVFYCGPHPLSRQLRQLSHQHHFRFFKESF